jgi:hypothetical protein
MPEHLLQQLVGFCRNIIRQIGAILLWGKEWGLGVLGVVKRIYAADEAIIVNSEVGGFGYKWG